jgi:hypothetical protein
MYSCEDCRWFQHITGSCNHPPEDYCTKEISPKHGLLDDYEPCWVCSIPLRQQIVDNPQSLEEITNG